MRKRIKYLILANVMFVVYSLASVFTKLASGEGGITSGFIIFYGIALGFLAVFALMWQQIIKKLPLMVAFANKAVVVMWGLVWSVLFFHDTVTAGKVVGIVMVMAGIVLFASSELEEKA